MPNDTQPHKLLSPKLVALLAAMILLGGCSDGRPKRVPVSGKITIDGEPLRFGSILFVPPEGRPAAGGIDNEGRFFLTTYEKGDGIIPGNYKVQIKGTEPIGESAQRWHAPVKYSKAAESGFEIEVTEPTDTVLFELTWDGGKPFVEKF